VIDELIPVVGKLSLDEDNQHLVVMAALRGIDLQVREFYDLERPP